MFDEDPDDYDPSDSWIMLGEMFLFFLKVAAGVLLFLFVLIDLPFMMRQ